MINNQYDKRVLEEDILITRLELEGERNRRKIPEILPKEKTLVLTLERLEEIYRSGDYNRNV